MTDFGPRRMVDIDIAQPLAELGESPDFAGTFAIVWRGYVPLCTLDLVNGQLPLPPAAVLQGILQEATANLGWRLFGEGFAGSPPLPPPVPRHFRRDGSRCERRPTCRPSAMPQTCSTGSIGASLRRPRPAIRRFP
jgi:hypothetical protein